jgi:hypothetical protein
VSKNEKLHKLQIVLFSLGEEKEDSGMNDCAVRVLDEKVCNILERNNQVVDLR